MLMHGSVGAITWNSPPPNAPPRGPCLCPPPELAPLESGRRRAPLVNRLANDVHDAPERALADGDRDRHAHVRDLLAANKALRGIHGNGAHSVLTQVLGNLKDQPDLVALNLRTRANEGWSGVLEVGRTAVYASDNCSKGMVTPAAPPES